MCCFADPARPAFYLLRAGSCLVGVGIGSGAAQIEDLARLGSRRGIGPGCERGVGCPCTIPRSCRLDVVGLVVIILVLNYMPSVDRYVGARPRSGEVRAWCGNYRYHVRSLSFVVSLFICITRSAAARLRLISSICISLLLYRTAFDPLYLLNVSGTDIHH